MEFTYNEDATRAEVAYRRARIRHDLLPVIRRRRERAEAVRRIVGRLR